MHKCSEGRVEKRWFSPGSIEEGVWRDWHLSCIIKDLIFRIWRKFQEQRKKIVTFLSSSSICIWKILANEERSGNRNLNPSLYFTKTIITYKINKFQKEVWSLKCHVTLTNANAEMWYKGNNTVLGAWQLWFVSPFCLSIVGDLGIPLNHLKFSFFHL